MKADQETESAVVELFERFCSAVAAKDRDASLSLFVRDKDVALVTSEDALVRGPDELSAFFQGYVDGATTYSWRWDRRRSRRRARLRGCSRKASRLRRLRVPRRRRRTG